MAKIYTDTIPQELQHLPQWVNHTAKKIPINPANGRAAATDNPDTWGTFDAAMQRHNATGQGIGFVFTKRTSRFTTRGAISQ